MKRRPLFISFFTLGTPYEREARELEVTLRKFGCEYEIKGLPNLGDWCANCAQKSTFVRDAMLRREDRRLVFVDADARIEQVPVLFEELDCDIAYHLFHGNELLSGTLYFEPTDAAWHLVRDWQDRCKAEPGVWDQKHLHDAVVAAGNAIRIEHLPREYCFIFDSEPCDNPVIVHTQASRRWKQSVKLQ